MIFAIENFTSNPSSRAIATFSRYLFDAAIDPVTQKLYVIDSDGNLYYVDLTALRSTFIGAGPRGVNSLAFDKTGQAYMWSSDRHLYRINKNTGQVSDVGDTGYSASGDLAFDLDGTLFGTADNGYLIRINPGTGTSARLGLTGFSDFYGLAVGPSGVVFAGRGSDFTGVSEIYRINKTTGGSALVGSFRNGGYPIKGLALFNSGTSSASFGIRVPTDKQDFPLSEDQLTATPSIEFAVNGASDKVTWSSTELIYQTSGGRGQTRNTPYRLALAFETNGTASHFRKITAMGGQVTVRARTQVNGSQADATPVTVTVTGVSVPAEQITKRLVDLYAGGATPRLLTGLAEKESTYRQFTQRTLYGRNDLWPTESYDGGSHIGLLQMPTTSGIENCWSWLANTQAAAALFKEKLKIAISLEQKIIKQYKGLRPLTTKERENMALVLYGPGAMAGLDKQYYTVAPDGRGWKWVRNIGGNREGVEYADSVRAKIRNQ